MNRTLTVFATLALVNLLSVSAQAYSIDLFLQSLPNGVESVQINAMETDGAFFGSADTGTIFSSSGSSARAAGSANLATGQLRLLTEASGTSVNVASAQVGMQEVLLFHLPSGMTEATIGLLMDITGTTAGYVPGPVGLLEAGINAQSGGLFSEMFGETFAAGGSIPPAVINTQVFGEITVPDGAFVRLNPFLNSVHQGGTVDFSNTANFNIILPEGVTFTSQSGVFLGEAGEVGQVPEPRTLVLLASGLAALLWRRRRV